MIVDPDFLDHWRTGMVVDALGDAMAAMYILRLWAHCQERKSDTFVMPTRGLKAQCKFPGDAETFEAALIEAGFLERDGDTLHVMGWAEKNASLLAAWENGSKGGRPKKEPKQNPRVTQEEPSGNPDLTQTKPIREEKRREEKNSPSLRSGEARVAALTVQSLVDDGLTEQTAAEFIDHRKRKKAPLTARAWDGVKAQALKAGWPVEQAVCKAMERGWTSFEAEWVREQRGPPQAVNKQTALEERNRNVAADWLAQQGTA